MEWRERSTVSCDEAFLEAQRWVEAVTKKTFGGNNFRSALENGVLLCDLINNIKPGIIRRVNRLPTPIAGLDNLNVFLKACGKLGLKEAQLFHPGDLQDLSTRVTVKRQETNRRLKNVLITIYWLGRRAHSDPYYNGPYLNLKAFEGLLGTALYKVLEESSGQRSNSVRDSGFGDGWYSEREELFPLRGGGGGGAGGHRREDSLDSLDSLGSRPHSVSSDTTLKGSSEGCCSDAEADSVFRMAENKDGLSYRRSLVITPKSTTPFNQFLPSKDKPSGYVPAPLRRKRAERHEDNRRSWASPMYTEEDGTFTSETRLSSGSHDNGRVSQSSLPAAHLQWAYEYESGSDSDADRPDPDLVLDDLAGRRFHSPSPAPLTNFALPISALEAGGVSGGRGSPWPKVTMSPNAGPQQNVTCLSSSSSNNNSVALQAPQQGSARLDNRRPMSADSLLRQMYDDSEEDDEDDEVGYADPVQDDVYARKLGLTTPPATNVPYDKFLPKFWTPEEDIHIQKIKLGSQRRPWYKKMQGFSHGKTGSSSDDSECDTSPWLSSAPSPSSGPSPYHPHTPEASTRTTRVVGKRVPPKCDSSDDGSKSMNDIQVDPAVLRQARFEELQKHREQAKESEDKWQDDLTKWKNRRKSVNSDIVKKKEEREEIEHVTSTSSSRRSKTFKEMQEERGNRDRSSIGSRLGSLSYLDQDDDDAFENPVASPRTRALPARSYTIDTPYSPLERFSTSSVSSLKEEDPPAAAPAPDRATSPPASQEVDIVESPAGSDPTATTAATTTSTSSSRSSNYGHYSPPASPMEWNTSTSTAKTEETSASTISSASRALPKVPEPRRPWAGTQPEAEAPSSGSLYKQPQSNSMEAKPPGVSRVSASVPRSYQRSDSARLSSVVTARPFGTQSTGLSSVPRAFTMDDTHKRVNGDLDVSKKLSVPSRYHQFMTSEDEARSSSAQSSEDEEEEEEGASAEKGISPAQDTSPVPPQVKSEAPVSPAPAKDTNQESYCDMRISLNQKPNSSRDFGFHADWDSTGAHVSSIQPGSPAEMCQLQAGDEVLTVNGHRVADMSYAEWKAGMEEALQQGSLVVDIRRHGRKSVSDPRGVNTSLDFTSRIPMEPLRAKELPTRPIDVASNGLNSGFHEEPVTMRNKDSEPISLKNLKRRSEFFEQGGAESAISDIPVPSITPSSNHWSWDPEEERRRQEKWQKEQERLLQEKYRRDQEKLDEEWRRAQEEATSVPSTPQQEATSVPSSPQQEEPRSLELYGLSVSPRSPLSPLSQPTPPWEEEQREAQEEEEEERKRREEQERQRQAEERRKREEEERELRRLQEERLRRERQEEEERKSREEEERRWQERREQEREEERRRQEAAEQQRREKERERDRALEQEQQQQQQLWGGESYGYANVQPQLSFADRTKSRSTPQLDEVEKPETKGFSGRSGGMAHWLLEEELRRKRDRQAQSQRAASELELERRNILNAMRYREPERVTGGDVGEASWRDAQKKGQQASQAEQERQQILQEMKKKTHLLTDNSWIRQRSTTAVPKEPISLPMRRGESLDNLDTPRSTWRSSWTPGSTSSIPNYSRPHSALSGHTSSSYVGGTAARPASATLPSSYSMGSLRGGAGTPSSPWSQHSPTPSSPSPTTSPEPASESRLPQQRSRSVSGKKMCTFCASPLGKGAAMIIESLGLCYHLGCFKCIDCKSDLGGSESGAEVRIRNKQLYCNACYMRFRTGQPTSM